MSGKNVSDFIKAYNKARETKLLFEVFSPMAESRLLFMSRFSMAIVFLSGVSHPPKSPISLEGFPLQTGNGRYFRFLGLFDPRVFTILLKACRYLRL